MRHLTLPPLPNRIPLPLVLGGAGGGAGISAKLINTYGALEVWPLVNMSEGRTIFAANSPTRDGVFETWDLQNTAGPMTGGLAPYSNAAATDRGSLWSANGLTGLVDVFNGVTGSFIFFVKPNATTYTQSKHVLAMETASGSFLRMAFVANTNITLSFRCAGGSTNSFVSTAYQGVTDWLMFGVSWSQAANQTKGYIYRQGVGGGQIGSTLTYSGTFGTLTPLLMCLGTHQLSSTGSDQPIDCAMAYAMLKAGAVWSEADMAAIFADVMAGTPDTAPARQRISYLGDSITVGLSAGAYILSYPYQVARGITGGGLVLNHAVGGETILTHLAGQVTAAANDNADIIIIELGTNDNNAGNMATLQAAAESGIAALKLSNPNAAIYWLNVLPRWTDATGATPVDKGNIRTAVAAACTAQSITCWDTFTTPWIAAANTNDGLHPNDSGQALVATEALARL